MKVELKNTDFKYLYEVLNKAFIKFPLCYDDKVADIIQKQLKPQYIKAFMKYQNQTQNFKIGEDVLFKKEGVYATGKVARVSRAANGQFRYIIKYRDEIYDEDLDGTIIVDTFTNLMTDKHIRKNEVTKTKTSTC